MTDLSTPKVALVTGSARRIGREIVTSLHTQGFNVAIHFHRSLQQAESLQTELNQKRENSAILVEANLHDRHSPQHIINSVSHQWGRLDLLINNASSFFPTPVSEYELETFEKNWDELMGSNLKAPYFLAMAALPFLKSCKGKIINIIDIHGLSPLKNHSIYCMAKAGLAMMTQSLAKDLAPDIEVNGIAPGAILWPENEAELTESVQKVIIQKSALKTVGKPKDIANAVVFLACHAQYMTGTILKVDGGRMNLS